MNSEDQLNYQVFEKEAKPILERLQSRGTDNGVQVSYQGTEWPASGTIELRAGHKLLTITVIKPDEEILGTGVDRVWGLAFWENAAGSTKRIARLVSGWRVVGHPQVGGSDIELQNFVDAEFSHRFSSAAGAG